MEYADILNRIAPCGLSCEQCFAFRGGRIKALSAALSQQVGNFGPFASRFADLPDEPAFTNYPAFTKQLDYFCEVSCKGCRREKCKLFKTCRVRQCSGENKVDFCFQCSRFPCMDSGFDKSLEARWKENNRLMKNIGIEAYYLQVSRQPRYK